MNLGQVLIIWALTGLFGMALSLFFVYLVVKVACLALPFC